VRLTIHDTARYLDVSEETIYRWIRDAKIPFSAGRPPRQPRALRELAKKLFTLSTAKFRNRLAGVQQILGHLSSPSGRQKMDMAPRAEIF